MPVWVSSPGEKGVTEEPTTRQRIRREAAALFREKGFNGTSMSDLAAEVGMTKSSLYHHFPSKQALLSEIIELTVSRVTPLMEEIIAMDLPVDERLRRAVILHTVEGIRDQDALACFVEEGRFLEPEFMAAHVAKRDNYEALFRRIFEEGAAQGVFVQQDLGIAVRAVLGMCNSVVRWYRPDGARSPEEIAGLFAEYALRGARKGEVSVLD